MPPLISSPQRDHTHPEIDLLSDHDLANAIASLNPRPAKHTPHIECNIAALLHAIAQQHYNKPSINLLPADQAQLIQQHCLAAAGRLGWTRHPEKDSLLVKPIQPDLESARSHLRQMLASQETPFMRWKLVEWVSIGAYERNYYALEFNMPPELEAIIQEELIHARFHPQTNGLYAPTIPPLPPDAPQRFETALRAAATLTTRGGQSRLLPTLTVKRALEDITQQSLNQYQTTDLLNQLADVFIRLGYDPETNHVPVRDLLDPPDHLSPNGGLACYTPTIRIDSTPKELTLAKGLRVFAPTIIIDDESETLVALHIYGPPQSVKANWAALMNHGTTSWINRCRITLNGAKSHITLRGSLPCGWSELWLIHKQASFADINPTHDAYILDDGRSPVPATFFPMLDKILAAPLLPAWAPYLWVQGRKHQLIRPLGDSNVGAAGWALIPSPAWHENISAGLQSGAITIT